MRSINRTLSDNEMKLRSILRPRICICCGEHFTRRSENPNVCIPCFVFLGTPDDVQPMPEPKSAAKKVVKALNALKR
jgi:hypothetical protein